MLNLILMLSEHLISSLEVENKNSSCLLALHSTPFINTCTSLHVQVERFIKNSTSVHSCKASWKSCWEKILKKELYAVWYRADHPKQKTCLMQAESWDAIWWAHACRFHQSHKGNTFKPGLPANHTTIHVTSETARVELEVCILQKFAVPVKFQYILILFKIPWPSIPTWHIHAYYVIKWPKNFIPITGM